MSAKFAWGAPRDANLAVSGTRRFLDRWASNKADIDVAESDVFGSPDEAIILLRNFESSGRGWFWATDANGILTYLSAPIIALLNKTPAEIRGEPFSNLFCGVENESGQRSLPFILTKQSKFDDLPLQAATQGDEIWGCFRKTVSR